MCWPPCLAVYARTIQLLGACRMIGAFKSRDELSKSNTSKTSFSSSFGSQGFDSAGLRLCIYVIKFLWFGDLLVNLYQNRVLSSVTKKKKKKTSVLSMSRGHTHNYTHDPFLVRPATQKCPFFLFQFLKFRMSHYFQRLKSLFTLWIAFFFFSFPFFKSLQDSWVTRHLIFIFSISQLTSLPKQSSRQQMNKTVNLLLRWWIDVNQEPS